MCSLPEIVVIVRCSRGCGISQYVPQMCFCVDFYCRLHDCSDLYCRLHDCSFSLDDQISCASPSGSIAAEGDQQNTRFPAGQNPGSSEAVAHELVKVLSG